MLGVMPELVLLRPASALLDSYRAALEAGWSPHNLRGAAVAAEHLAAIAADPEGFLASLEQPPGRAGTVRLPDGSRVPRLPGFTRWLSDGEFCGAIHFRWQPGTEPCRPMCSAMSATPSSPGSAAAASPAAPWPCSCPRPAPAASAMWS
jgi:hypothetical protein